MKMRCCAAIVALLVLLGVGQAPAETKGTKKEDASFGAIKTPEPSEIKKEADAWLASVKNDAATQAEAKKIWESDRPMLDKVAAILALGDDRVARLLSGAKDADGAAPTELPTLLKEAKATPFFRANLALAYGKALTTRKVFEEALDALALAKPEDVVDPAAYFFHRAVCEYELMLKDKADASIDRLLVDVSESPERYRMVGALMHFDMATWKEKDLGWVARKMENIQRRLDLKRGGKETQRQQKEVLIRLDEMIKELENQCKCNGSCPNDGNCPGGSCPNPGDGPGKDRSSAPQRDTNGGSANGTGQVDSQKVKEVAELWGKLPEKERAQAMRDLTRNLPAKDRAVIEAYLKELQKRSSK